MSKLLLANADVNLHLQEGASPLYVAAQNGFLEVVQELLEATDNVDLARKVCRQGSWCAKCHNRIAF